MDTRVKKSFIVLEEPCDLMFSPTFSTLSKREIPVIFFANDIIGELGLGFCPNVKKIHLYKSLIFLFSSIYAFIITGQESAIVVQNI